jgi:hypothetical protein
MFAETKMSTFKALRMLAIVISFPSVQLPLLSYNQALFVVSYAQRVLLRSAALTLATVSTNTLVATFSAAATLVMMLVWFAVSPVKPDAVKPETEILNRSPPAPAVKSTIVSELLGLI